MREEWWELSDMLIQAAEGFAATDPPNAWVYRQEASDFAVLDPPADADELAALEARAQAIRLGWSDLLRRSQPSDRRSRRLAQPEGSTRRHDLLARS